MLGHRRCLISSVYPPLFLAIHHWTPCNLSVLLFGNIAHKIQKYGRTNHYLLPPGLWDCGVVEKVDDCCSRTQKNDVRDWWAMVQQVPTSTGVSYSTGSRVKESRGTGSCNFPTDISKFPTEEIICAENSIINIIIIFCRYYLMTFSV